MSVENPNGSGAPDDNSNPGGAQDQAGGASGDINDEGGKPKVVPRDEHERALNDMHKFKKSWRDAQAKIDELSGQIEEIRNKDLENKEDYKGLWETERGKRQETETKYNSLRSNLELTQKHSSVQAELLKAGLQPGAEALIDKDEEIMEMVQVEYTSQGRMIVNGADSAADLFKQKYPFAFGKDTGSNVNSGGGRGGKPPAPTKWDGQSLRKLELDCKRKGDMVPYYKAHDEFRKQRLG